MPTVRSRDASTGLRTASESYRTNPPRSPPNTVKVLLPVWGYRYVKQFLELGLPTLLAPGNVPALTKALPCEFEILTGSEDATFIGQHPAFLSLAGICKATIRHIDRLITAGNSATTLTLAYVDAIRASGRSMLDTCFIFLNSDYIVADGSLASVLARMQAGAGAILAGNFQVIAEDATPWLRGQTAREGAPMTFPPRALLRWAFGHLHPATLANIVNLPVSHNAHTNRVFWRVDSDTLIGRFYLMHVISLHPEVADFNIGASWDYSFVPEMCPSGNVSAMTDSDDYLVVEMQPRDHESEFLRPDPLRPKVLARTLCEWTTARHRQNVDYSIVYHADDPPAAISAAIATADAYVAQVSRWLRRRPQPHYGHPYWLGTIAAFREATAQRISAEEFGALVGMRIQRGVWIERLRTLLFGAPPRVRPWHPRWPDYRPITVGLADFFAAPDHRLLLISDARTAVSATLDDGGKRVTRLQASPFLQTAAERYKDLAGIFDACLVESDTHDPARVCALVERIVALMKDGGKILIFVHDEQPIDQAERFAAEVKLTLQRLLPSSTSVNEVRFAAASRLRLESRRMYARLAMAVHRRPWLGVPAAALLGVPLTLLTLIVNLLAGRGKWTSLRRGTASSLHVVVRTHASRALSGP